MPHAFSASVMPASPFLVDTLRPLGRSAEVAFRSLSYIPSLPRHHVLLGEPPSALLPGPHVPYQPRWEASPVSRDQSSSAHNSGRFNPPSTVMKRLPHRCSKIFGSGFICPITGLFFAFCFPTGHQAPAPLTKCLWQVIAFSDRMLNPRPVSVLQPRIFLICVYL